MNLERSVFFLVVLAQQFAWSAPTPGRIGDTMLGKVAAIGHLHISPIGDSLLGRTVKTITTTGQFVSFDKDHPDRAFIADAMGMSINLILSAPEMDCFLANHVKDNLSFTYE